MINTSPDAEDLWIGIAGHFDSLTQVLCEFIDNSVADIEARNSPPRSIQILVEEINKNEIKFQIEDQGSGIEDFEPVMRLGDKSVQKRPLNEHGFGLKHALASANPENNAWVIYTRTPEEFNTGKYRCLSARYAREMNVKTYKISSKPWPGTFNGSGTIVEFVTDQNFFDTLQKGIKGSAKFTRSLDYLVEELGYIYAGVIEKGVANFTVASKGATYSKSVGSVKPDWADFYHPGEGTAEVDLGGGNLKIEYKFGEMRESNHVKHYKRNQSTSGVEIRFNGRVMMSNVFKDIWLLENHPTYNHFLVILNLVSDKKQAFPKTRTSKNGIRSGDPKLAKLFAWIKQTHPEPHKDLASATSEKQLVDQLAEYKKLHIRAKEKSIFTQYRVFKTLECSVYADLYVFDGRDVVLYEAKKDNADIQDLYQLIMYWDGSVEDGVVPTEGVLIATTFSGGVKVMIKAINGTEDKRGNKYNLVMRKWSDEGIKYPR